MLKAKKNKIVLGTILGVALVSLASVGFAQWQVGVQQKNDDKSFNIEIDTATQNTAAVEINVKSGEQLRIAELTAVSDPNKNVTMVDQTKTGNFDIELDKYRIIVDNNHQVSSVTYEVYVGNTNDETAKNRFKAKKANVDELIHPSYTENNLSYIKLKTANIDSNATFKDHFIVDDSLTLAGHTVYKPNVSMIQFDWGDFFGDKSPATYYESKMSTAKNIEDKIKMSNGIINEINGMKSIVDDLAEGERVVHIKVSIETEAASK